jgi:hypothetical protein
MQKEQPIAFGVVGAGLKLRATPTRRLDQMRAGGFGDGAGLVVRAAVDQDCLLHDALDHGRDQSRERMRQRALRVQRGNDHRNHGAEPIGARPWLGNRPL